MYKDKDRQRQAVREATRRWRERKGITSEAKSVTPCDTQGVIPIKPKHRVISIKDMVPHWTPDDPMPPQSYNPMMAGYVPPT